MSWLNVPHQQQSEIYRFFREVYPCVSSSVQITAVTRSKKL